MSLIVLVMFEVILV